MNAQMRQMLLMLPLMLPLLMLPLLLMAAI